MELKTWILFTKMFYPDPSCYQIKNITPVDHFIFVHLHLHSILQAETTCQRTGPRRSRNAHYQASNERCPHSRHCCSAVSTQYHRFAGCDIPQSLPWQITWRPSKATAENHLRRGHVCECHMQPSYLRMEK